MAHTKLRVALTGVTVGVPVLALGVGGWALGRAGGAAAFAGAYAAIALTSAVITWRHHSSRVAREALPRPDVGRYVRSTWRNSFGLAIGLGVMDLVLLAAGLPFKWVLLIVLIVGMGSAMLVANRSVSQIRGATREDFNLMFDIETQSKVWPVMGLGIAVGLPLMLVVVIIVSR